MSSSWDKYAQAAERWSDDAYADASSYLARRAELVRTLGPALAPGDKVLDLACGDGGLADFLPEQRYAGVDAVRRWSKRRGVAGATSCRPTSTTMSRASRCMRP